MTIQRRERINTVLWVLVQCLLYFATYDLHKKNNINTHKVVAERVVLLLRRKEEDLVEHRVSHGKLSGICVAYLARKGDKTT